MMSRPDDDMPAPEPIWIALAIVVWALALSMTPTRRKRFIGALKMLTNRHEASERVVRFEPGGRRDAAMSAALRSALSWLKRLIGELERAAGE